LWEPDWTKAQQSRDAFAVTTYEADAALAKDLLAALRETWPHHLELFNPLESPLLPEGSTDAAVTIREKRPLPTANAVISSRPAPGRPGQYRWLPAPRLSADAAANAGRLTRAAIRMQRLAAPPPGGKPLSGVVLDFTTAPDLLWPCLRLLKDSPAPPVAETPAATGFQPESAKASASSS
jgi:hypothetical protein